MTARAGEDEARTRECSSGERWAGWGAEGEWVEESDGRGGAVGRNGWRRVTVGWGTGKGAQKHHVEDATRLRGADGGGGPETQRALEGKRETPGRRERGMRSPPGSRHVAGARRPDRAALIPARSERKGVGVTNGKGKRERVVQSRADSRFFALGRVEGRWEETAARRAPVGRPKERREKTQRKQHDGQHVRRDATGGNSADGRERRWV